MKLLSVFSKESYKHLCKTRMKYAEITFVAAWMNFPWKTFKKAKTLNPKLTQSNSSWKYSDLCRWFEKEIEQRQEVFFLKLDSIQGYSGHIDSKEMMMELVNGHKDAHNTSSRKGFSHRVHAFFTINIASLRTTSLKVTQAYTFIFGYATGSLLLSWNLEGE